MLEGLLRGLRRRVLKARGWRGVASYLRDGGRVDLMVVVPVIRSLGGCPGRDVLEAIASAGLYEELVLLASRGCDVPGDLLGEARLFFASAGLVKWEEAASRLLGVESLYDTARSSVVYAVCLGGRAWVGVGYPPRVTVEMGVARGARWAGTPQEAIEALLERGRPALYVYWGPGCPRHPAVPRVDARALLSIAFPDVEPTIASAAYHFDVDPSCPPCVVARASSLAAGLLARLGVDWERLPEEVRWARGLPAERPPEPPGHVVVTDRPLLSKPLYKPYHVEAPGLDAGEGWDYAARLALASLAARPGDPARAYALKRGLPLDGVLPGMIAASVRPGAPRLPRGRQVEPWHLAVHPRPARVEYRCAGPPGLCLRREPPWWEEALARAAGLPEPRPYTGPPIPGASSSPVSPGDASAGVEGPRPAGFRVHAHSRGVTRPCEAAEAGLQLAGGERPLLVAPAPPLARAVARCLDAVFLDEEGVDAWLARGGPASASWRFLAEHPEAGKAASSLVLLYPERLASGLGEAAALAAYAGAAVSRALEAAAREGEVDAVLGGSEPRPGRDVGLDVGDLLEYAREVFARHWRGVVDGEPRLRPYQEAALRVIFEYASSGRPGTLLAVLPTGSGKSAIFQVAARVLADNGLGSTALVVSPLRALMHDQVRGAAAKGFRAAYIDSSVPRGERLERLRAASGGLLDLLYITPERFSDPLFESMLSESTPALVVLDEAHTLSRWGMSFRPGYLYMARKLARLRDERRWPPLVALTATAPDDVVRDVMESVGSGAGYVEVRVSLREDPRLSSVDPERDYVLRAPPLRDELVLDVEPSPPGEQRLEDLARVVSELRAWADSQGGPWVGVVFTGYVRSTRRSTLNAPALAEFLESRLGEPVAVYHGQLGERERRRVEEAIARAAREGGAPRIVVATKAFGMGVDIPRIRFVVHATPSDSVEDYYQEVGRAGRDGRQAIAVTLFDRDDFDYKRRLKRREAVKPSQALEVYNAIVAVAGLSRDSRTALVPAGLLAAVAGGEEAAGRALEALRVAGLLEYTTLRGRARVSRGRGCLVDLRGGGCVDFDVEGQAYSVELCRRDPPLYSASLGRGSCHGEHLEPVGRNGAYVLVELSPDVDHRQDTLLPPEAFVVVAALRAEEIARVDELQALLERAAAARMRGGRSAANAELRRGIAEYFSRPRRPRPSPDLASPRRIECEALNECVEEAARLAARLEEALGPHGYTVAAQREDHAAKLRAALESAIGRRFEDPRRAYRRVTAALRDKPPHALMDYGYLVLLVDSRSRAYQALSSRLADYRYHALIAYKPRPR